MLTRFGIGLIKGLLVGGLLLAALVFGAGQASVPVWAGYLLAIAIGAITGLVAGKPIWQQDARIEAGLKAAAGAILAPLVLFALRKWVPLPMFPKGTALAGGMTVVAFPVVTMVLGLLFELDNTPSNDEKAPGEAGKPKAEGGKVRVPGEASLPDELPLADESLDLPASQPEPRRRQQGRRLPPERGAFAT